MNRAILAAALVAASLPAQGTDYLILCGFSDSQGPNGPNGNSYPISRQRDLNGDGVLDESPAETFAFLTTSYNTANAPGSFMSDMDWVREGDSYAFYIADSGDGKITRGVDADNDGLLGPTEVTQFFDFQSAFSPDGIAVYRDQSAANPQTIVYVAQDDSGSPFGRGIHRLVDLNGDGDATDPGEQTVFVSAAQNLTVPNRAGTGTTTLVSHFWEQVHTLDDGTVIAYSRGSTSVTTANNPDQYVWYAFTDNNGVASASVFFNPSLIPDVATHPSFDTGGAFPAWDAQRTDPATMATKDIGLCEFFAAAPSSGFGPREYYFAAGYNSNFIFTNAAGQNVHGLFYKWTDTDGDFRIGATEISLFGNLSNGVVAGVQPFTYQIQGTPIAELSDRIFAIRAVNGGLHVCWGATVPANKHVFSMTDANANGTIETGEAQDEWLYGNGGTHVWNAQFGPFIKDWAAFDPGFMPGPFAPGLVPYGQGCPHPFTNLAPVCGAYNGGPTQGNQGFQIAVERVPASSSNFAFFGIGRGSARAHAG